MMLCYIPACVIVIFGTFLMSFPVNGENGVIVPVTVLAEESNPDHRVRRTADSRLPDRLSCGFSFRNDSVVLRLKMSRLVPVVTSDAQDMEAVNSISHDSAVYTYSSAGSAMIVKQVNGEYSLDGSFFHDNQEWTLQPLTKLNGGNDYGKDGSFHRIFPANVKNTTLSFINDMLLDTDKWEHAPTHALKKNGDHLQKITRNRTSKRRRHKRATVHHVIEIAFIADFEDYSKWKRHVGAENAVSAMRLWYTFIAESINIRYRTIKDPDFAISIIVTVLKILTNPNDAKFISNLVNANGMFRGFEGLNAFRKWYPKQSDIPPSDHYMLMTGYDVIGSSGIAISSRMCTELSLSICEDSFTGSLGGVAAHELGHSLSAVHDMDTTGPNRCSDTNQYVMSTVFTSPVSSGNEGNPWRFSPCSIKSIKAYLNEVSCTLPEHTSGVNELPVPNDSNRAGQVLFKNAQCVLAFRDSRSSFCEPIQMQNGGLNSLCGGMYCSIPNDWMESCQTVVPQEFTPCGTGKWCVAGRCIEMEALSSTPSSSSSAVTTIPATTATSQPSFMVPETASSASATTTLETIGSPQVSKAPTSTRQTTQRETRAAEVTNTPTVAQENTSQVLSPHSQITPATADTSTSPTIPIVTIMPTTPTLLAATTSIELTTPVPTNSTPSGIPDVSMCNYLIYLKKGTEWWHCVQRALGRTERAPRPVRRLPIRRGRVYIRRFRFIY